ncbi:MAG TPA: hypothetical protein VHC22_07020 [Pirellulales bacterium]|nr:hypothetical protein [Pirellulales bacterium]
MPRQFSLKTLLWLMACVACFAGGLAIGRQHGRPYMINRMRLKASDLFAPGYDDSKDPKIFWVRPDLAEPEPATQE